jgi:sulfur relay (sulfurtransferase) DsrC/TusE family protein
MNDPSHIKVSVLVRKFYSRITYITSFRIIVITSTRKHTRSTVNGKHIEEESRGLYERGLHRSNGKVVET